MAADEADDELLDSALGTMPAAPGIAADEELEAVPAVRIESRSTLVTRRRLRRDGTRRRGDPIPLGPIHEETAEEPTDTPSTAPDPIPSPAVAVAGSEAASDPGVDLRAAAAALDEVQAALVALDAADEAIGAARGRLLARADALELGDRAASADHSTENGALVASEEPPRKSAGKVGDLSPITIDEVDESIRPRGASEDPEVDDHAGPTTAAVRVLALRTPTSAREF